MNKITINMQEPQRGATPEKPLTEKETRAKFRTAAYVAGLDCGKQYDQIIDRYDKILKRCTNQSEQQAIGVMCVTEIYRLFSARDGLMVDGKEIIPTESDWKQDETLGKIKLD